MKKTQILTPHNSLRAEFEETGSQSASLDNFLSPGVSKFQAADILYSLQFASAGILNHCRCSDHRRMGVQFTSLGSPFCFQNRYTEFITAVVHSFDSSVGRAEDCSEHEVILRSLVRIRLEGIFFSLGSAIFYLIPLTFHAEINEKLSFCSAYFFLHFLIHYFFNRLTLEQYKNT